MAYFRSGVIPPDILTLPTIGTASGSIATFKTDLSEPLVNVKCSIKPAQSGSGTPTPSNPRPLIGYTGMNITKAGVNLFNASVDNITEGSSICTISGSTITNTGANAYDAVRFEQYLKPDNYVMNASNITTNGIIQVAYYDGSYHDLGYLLSNAPTLQFTVPTGATKIRVSLYSSQAGGMSVTDLQCELGSTATAYHAYNGTTYPNSWTDEAGTIYGGTLDVTTGTLTVTHKGYKLNDLTWVYNSGLQTFISIGNTEIDRNVTDDTYLSGLKCSIFQTDSVNNTIFGANNYRIASNATGDIFISDFDYTDVTAFLSAYGNEDIMIPLATPVVYSLTGVNLFAIANQVNNVFADTGDTEVKFLETVGHHIA